MVLFSVILSSLFIKHSMTEDWTYDVNGIYDDDFNLINYEVNARDTVELYDLEDSEVNILMILSISLAVSSIAYVLVSYKKEQKHNYNNMKQGLSMKKITGGITFISAGAGLIFLFFVLFTENVFREAEGGFAWIGFFLLSLTIIHYTVSTKFWTSKLTALESLDRETEIIKRQIEKRELLAKLESLERK